MPKARMPVGKSGHLKFAGKPKKGKKGAAVKGAGKMPFGATKAPGARKAQPAMKKAGMPKPKKARKKKQ